MDGVFRSKARFTAEEFIDNMNMSMIKVTDSFGLVVFIGTQEQFEVNYEVVSDV